MRKRDSQGSQYREIKPSQPGSLIYTCLAESALSPASPMTTYLLKRPNIVIGQISISPENPQPGDSLKIGVLLENVGEDVGFPAQFYIKVANMPLKKFVLPRQAPHSQCQLFITLIIPADAPQPVYLLAWVNEQDDPSYSWVDLFKLFLSVDEG